MRWAYFWKWNFRISYFVGGGGSCTISSNKRNENIPHFIVTSYRLKMFTILSHSRANPLFSCFYFFWCSDLAQKMRPDSGIGIMIHVFKRIPHPHISTGQMSIFQYKIWNMQSQFTIFFKFLNFRCFKSDEADNRVVSHFFCTLILHYGCFVALPHSLSLSLPHSNSVRFILHKMNYSTEMHTVKCYTKINSADQNSW